MFRDALCKSIWGLAGIRLFVVTACLVNIDEKNGVCVCVCESGKEQFQDNKRERHKA